MSDEGLVRTTGSDYPHPDPEVRHPRPWRVGTKLGRTIYDANDELIGMMDDPELANQVITAVNALPERE